MFNKALTSFFALSLCTLVCAQEKTSFIPGNYTIKRASDGHYATAQDGDGQPVMLTDRANTYSNWYIVAAGETIVWRIQNIRSQGWTWRNPAIGDGVIYSDTAVEPSDWVFTPDGSSRNAYTIRDFSNGTFWKGDDDDTIETSASGDIWIFTPI